MSLMLGDPIGRFGGGVTWFRFYLPEDYIRPTGDNSAFWPVPMEVTGHSPDITVIPDHDGFTKVSIPAGEWVITASMQNDDSKYPGFTVEDGGIDLDAVGSDGPHPRAWQWSGTLHAGLFLPRCQTSATNTSRRTISSGSFMIGFKTD